MTKKHFIALADAIREHNESAVYNHDHITPFTQDQILTLAYFLGEQNSNFKSERWLGYIAGTCGKNGGKRTSAGYAGTPTLMDSVEESKKLLKPTRPSQVRY